MPASLDKVAAELEDDLRRRGDRQEREPIEPGLRQGWRPWPKKTKRYQKHRTPRERRETPQLMARPEKKTLLTAWSTNTLEVFGPLSRTGSLKNLNCWDGTTGSLGGRLMADYRRGSGTLWFSREKWCFTKRR